MIHTPEGVMKMDKDFFYKNKKMMYICIFAVIILFLFVKLHNNSMEEGDVAASAFGGEQTATAIPEELIKVETANEEMKPAIIFVDMKGAILRPGVYKLEENDRVQDAIMLAGGFLDDADETKINLAARVVDEMVIYVPKIGEQNLNDVGEAIAAQSEDGRININNATSEQLQELPGIGAAKAASIVAYREQHGPFKKIDDLVNVSGIGEKIFDQLKDLIKVH